MTIDLNAMAARHPAPVPTPAGLCHRTRLPTADCPCDTLVPDQGRWLSARQVRRCWAIAAETATLEHLLSPV